MALWANPLPQSSLSGLSGGGAGWRAGEEGRTGQFVIRPSGCPPPQLFNTLPHPATILILLKSQRQMGPQRGEM